MRSTPKLRQPRTRFAMKAKPRLKRGWKRKGGTNLCSSNPIRKAAAGQRKTGRRINRLSEWTDPRSYITKDKRHKLYGKDKSRLRERVYQRSGGRCEAPKHHFTCGGWADEFNGHLAHKRHGANKTDTMDGTFWAYWACHLIEQHKHC